MAAWVFRARRQHSESMALHHDLPLPFPAFLCMHSGVSDVGQASESPVSQINSEPTLILAGQRIFGYSVGPHFLPPT